MFSALLELYNGVLSEIFGASFPFSTASKKTVGYSVQAKLEDMPESENNKFGHDLTSRNSGNSMSGVPIKKRLFRLTQHSSPIPQEPDVPGQDCGPMCLEPESTTTDNLTHPTFTIPPEPPAYKEDIEMKSSNVKYAYLPNSLWQLTSSLDAKNNTHNLVNQVRAETCSSDLPLAPQKTFSETNAEVCAANSVSRLNLDLNIPVDVWDATVNGSVTECNMHKVLNDSDKCQEKLEACTKQTIPLRINGTDVTSAKSVSGRCHYDQRLSNLGMPAEKHKSADLGLDLQLKPPGRPELCINWSSVAPDLTLSLRGNVSNSSKNIKPEPYIGKSDKDSMNCHLGKPKIVGLGHVKPEPSNQNYQDETAKKTFASDQRQEARSLVKMEPPKDQSREFYNRPAVGMLNTESDNNKPTHHMEVSGTVEAIDLNSVIIPDEKVCEVDGSVMIVNTNINTDQRTCVASASVVNSSYVESCKVEETLNSTCNLEYAEGSDTKGADLNADSVVLGVKENLVGYVNSEDFCLPSDPYHESAGPVALDGMSEGSAEMDCSDGEYYISSKSVAEGKLHLDSAGETLVGEKKQESMDVSSEIQENSADSQPPYDSPHFPRDEVLTHGADTGDLKNRNIFLHGAIESSCDGEKADKDRDLVPYGAIESSSVEGEKADTKIAASSTAPEDVTFKIASTLVVSNETQLQISDVRTSRSDETSDGNLCNDKNDTGSSLTTDLLESSGGRVPTISSGTRPTKPSEKANRKVKGSLIKSRSAGSSSSEVVKTSKDDVSSQQVKAKEADAPVSNPLSSELELDTNGLADQHVDNRGKSNQIRKVSSLGTNKSSSEKMKLSTSRLVISQTDRVGLIDKSHRWERSHSQGCRGERCNDRFLKYRSNDQDQPTRKRGYGLVNTRRDGNQMSVYGRDSGPRYAPKVNDSKGYRFFRPCSDQEVPLRIVADASVGSTGKSIRRFMDDEQPHRTRFPYRRRSPGACDRGVQISGRPSREVSPSRSAGRHVPDIPISCLPNEMIDPFLYADPCVKYEQAENHSMWRERSLSPTQRRGPPIHFPRMRSPYQFSPPRRSPDMGYGGHPELMQHRSPPVVKIDQMRSPPRRLCLPEYAMVRNDLHHSCLPNDMREMQELDLPRPGRGSQRNIRRFDLSGQQEVTEDYFGSLHFAQPLPLPHAEDELLARRKFDDNCSYQRSYGDHHPVGGDREEPFLYPGDCSPARCSPARPVRFYPNREGFSNRVSLRSPAMRMKNQLGSTTNRSRNMAEQEDYRNRSRPAWRDNSFNYVRLKRRRV
ncbi:hypothetical protein C4D60_Mb10t16500 [Musa balbisiana]|uniref:Uncharacterized protein n=1 Tax=Musa balbisiana TaxID=52838 RepID=A0A4S8IZ06_MUSBA|nr:hypothetical protein C4D60_Mb10t16500 [Musa balbisiana]